MSGRRGRRRLLSGGPLLWLAAHRLPGSSGTATAAGRSVSLDAPASIARLQVDEAGALLGVTASGELWRRADSGWLRLGAGIDAAAPLASGHGRIAARSLRGGLWLHEAGVAVAVDSPVLGAHAGMLVLPTAVIAIAVTAEGGGHRLMRFERDRSGRWREVARSGEPVLPDARPVLFPIGGGGDRRIAIFGGPTERYRHAVLGDGVEATTLLLVEPDRLATTARLELPEPHVFEDIAPRPVRWRDRTALLTVRSGPLGGQLAVVATDGPDAAALRIAALGPPIGRTHRWLAPSTDGLRILAVHTPHLAAILHRYRADGDALAADEVLRGEVSNHSIGERELDVSAWFEDSVMMPTRNGRGVAVLRLEPDGSVPVRNRVELDGRIVSLHRWDPAGSPGAVALLDDGRLAWIPS
jgi:hypothetical protein